MGAAWVIENKHRMIFTPDFDIGSDNFQNGVLDPREMGFYINDNDRLIEFVESIKKDFDLNANQVLTNRKINEFMSAVEGITTPTKPVVLPSEKDKVGSKNSVNEVNANPMHITPIVAKPAKSKRNIKQPPVERYLQDLANGKLKNEEVMIVYYAADTARYKLGVGWRTDEEVKKIQDWEELNDLGDTLSKGYDTAISRLEMRNLIEVSETTSHGNPRQVILVNELKEILLDLPEQFHRTCDEIARIALEKKNHLGNDDYLF